VRITTEPLELQVRGAVRDALTPAHGPDGPWARLLEVGAQRFGLPAERDGFDLGQGVQAAVCEELGRALAGSPYLDTMLAADCLGGVAADGLAAATAAARLALIAGGRLRVAVAAGEPGGDPADALRVDRAGGVWNGVTGPARGAADAEELLLVLDTGATASLAMVPRDEPGLALDPCPAFGPGACRVRLDRAEIGAGQVLATGAAGHALFAGALERARVRQAAYLCGMALGALEEAVRHAGARRQFGRRLVDLQVVQHGLAELLARLDAARLRVRHAAWSLDSGVAGAAAAPESLAMAAELALDASRAALHVHGARGMAAEWPVHGYYRWAIVEAHRLGSPRRLWEEAGRARLAERTGPA